MRDQFAVRVREAIQSLRRGDVVSYGQVAKMAGVPGAARAVGGVLRFSTGLPWWRVVYADGTMAPRHAAEQARRLRAEGVTVRHGRVVRTASSRASRDRARQK
jgi:methylated-DNA-protein-cysteine methyltransferase-like protein